MMSCVARNLILSIHCDEFDLKRFIWSLLPSISDLIRNTQMICTLYICYFYYQKLRMNKRHSFKKDKLYELGYLTLNLI